MDNNGLLKNSAIIIADAAEALKWIASNSVDCCVTSPPYYGLRDYGVSGQIGQEETPEEYIEKLVILFREIRRVLKPDGTLWVNIGDSYSGSGKGRNKNGLHVASKSELANRKGTYTGTIRRTQTNCKNKDLIGIPWLLAFALREDGWYLRQDIIWQKSNCLPESVKDRCTKSHEYIFLLSKSKRYYFDAESISEPIAESSAKRYAQNIDGQKGSNRQPGKTNGPMKAAVPQFTKDGKLHRNKRSVWTVSVANFRGGHFATFPEDLVKPCILAGSRAGGIVLDPFLGSGTTGRVAIDNGRAFIGIEINVDYAKISAKRTGVDLCINCQYNTNDFICRPECGGCDGASNLAVKRRAKKNAE